MVVKEIRGRRRYVAFTVPADVTKQMLIGRLRSLTEEPPYVVQCENGLAAVRCAPKEVDRLCALMGSAYPGSGSLMTSGTLKALRTKVPGLAATRNVKGKS